MRELNPDPEFDRNVLPALFSYRDAVPRAFVPPPLPRMRARAQRRAVVRGTALTGAAAGVVVAVGVAVALQGLPSTMPPPGDHTGSSSLPTSSAATASPTSAAQMPTSWAGETVVLPATPTSVHRCPQGRVTFTPASGQLFATTTSGRAVVNNLAISISETMATGDLTGDGQPEAVVYVHCVDVSPGVRDSGDGSGHLMVITRDSTGMLTGLAHVGPEGENYLAVKVKGGELVATIQQRYSPQVVQDRTYRWDGDSFEQVGGPTAFPVPMPTTWGGKTVVLPAPSGYRSCPQGPVLFANGKDTIVGDVVVGISETTATGDLTGDGQPEAVVNVHCRINSEFSSGDGTGHLLVITRDSAGTFIGLAHVGPDGEEYPTVRVRDGVLVATIRQRYAPQVVQERVYRWNGTTFEQVGGPTAFPSN